MTPDQVFRGITTRYQTARFVIGVVDFVARLIMVFGAVWFAWSMFSVLRAMADYMEYGASGDRLVQFGLYAILNLAPSLGMILAGILVFAQGQMLRATLDTADVTREILVQAKAAFGRPEHSARSFAADLF